jgi:hypothetical protein
MVYERVAGGVVTWVIDQAANVYLPGEPVGERLAKKYFVVGDLFVLNNKALVHHGKVIQLDEMPTETELVVIRICEMGVSRVVVLTMDALDENRNVEEVQHHCVLTINKKTLVVIKDSVKKGE